jgi:hypothetical protein
MIDEECVKKLGSVISGEVDICHLYHLDSHIHKLSYEYEKCLESMNFVAVTTIFTNCLSSCLFLEPRFYF